MAEDAARRCRRNDDERRLELGRQLDGRLRRLAVAREQLRLGATLPDEVACALVTDPKLLELDLTQMTYGG